MATVIWGADGTYNLEPPDSFLARGLHPDLPWPTEYVNWTFNHIWGVGIGAEHDPFTGAHTDITFNALAANDGVDADSVSLPANFALASGTAAFVLVGLGDWTLSTNGARDSNTLLGYPGEGPLFLSLQASIDAFVDLNTLIPGVRVSSDNVTITSLVFQVNGASGMDDLDWYLEKRNSTGAASFTLVDSGTIVEADVTAGTGGQAVAVSLGAARVVSGLEYWRLRIRGNGTNPMQVFGSAIFYDRTNNFAG